MSLSELLTLKQRIEDEIDEAQAKEPIGDGNAVLLDDMTEGDYEEYVKQVDNGWGPFIKKVLNLGINKDKDNNI